MRPTLYEYAGGDPALLALTAAFHGRCLADPELNHPFTNEDANPEHVPRLAAYWAEVLGGPATFSAAYNDQAAMLRMHTGNGDMNDLGTRFLGCFDAAVDDAALPADPVFRQCLHDYMVWAVDDVLSYREPEDVPGALGIPHWGWGGLEEPAPPPGSPA
jgi:hemoglobin